MPFVPDPPSSSGHFVPDQTPPTSEPTGTQDSTILGRALGGAIEPLAQMATSAIAAPIAGIAGLGTAAGSALGMTDEKPGDVVRSVESGLTYQPRSVGGKAASKVIGYPFEKLAQASQAAGGKVTDILSKVPALRGAPAALAGTGIDTALQALPMLLGARPGAAALERAPDILPRPSAPSGPMAEATAKARASGFVLPPTETRPSLLNRIIEGWGGKSNVEQAASIKNQPKTNALARKAIGLKPDAPINPTTLNAVREDAGKSYASVKNSKTPIEFDKEFIDAIDRMAGDYRGAQQRFPGLFKNDLIANLRQSILAPERIEKEALPGAQAPPIFSTIEKSASTQPFNFSKKTGGASGNIRQTLEQAAAQTPGPHSFGGSEPAAPFIPVPIHKMPSMTTAQAIETVKKLRYNATQRLTGRNFENPDSRALGFAERRAADAMDSLIERRLDEAGEKGLSQQYRKARIRIAQSYDVEAAHNQFTGNVDARKMAMIAGKRPLSAELRDIAEFGGAFKQVARPPESFGGHPGINPLDVGLALVEAASSGNPKWIGSVLARPAAAKIATSAPYQRRFTGPPSAPSSVSPNLLSMLLGGMQGTQNIPSSP